MLAQFAVKFAFSDKIVTRVRCAKEQCEVKQWRDAKYDSYEYEDSQDSRNT